MNVWILLMGDDITDQVIGPFTSVTVTSTQVVHGLTGRPILLRAEGGDWMTSDYAAVGDRFVVQQGGWESPWGERGRRRKTDA